MMHVPYYHFSVDDVFEMNYLGYLEELYKEFKTKTALYLFYEKMFGKKLRTLKERRVLDRKYPWLYFGPHGKNYETAPFDQTQAELKLVCENIYREIDRFAPGCCPRKLRLHYYTEAYWLADYFKIRKANGLFTTDRKVGAYCLPEEVKGSLLKSGKANYCGINFLRTHFRVEFLVEERRSEKELGKMFSETINEHGHIIIYTHECELEKPETLKYIDKIMKFFWDKKIVSEEHP